MESYIEDKKILYASILKFLEESDENNDDEISIESFQKLINVIKSQQIEGNSEEMHLFLEIIKSIGENHHRDHNFNERINKILLHYKEQIKQTLSNVEIFHIFENSKKIVLFLLKKEIITISDAIYKEMIEKIEDNGNLYWHFFIPELENFVSEEQMKSVKDEFLKENPTFFTNYEEKRQEGENDSYICFLIREDSVEEFISYVNQHNISPTSKILPSIFETNPFLIENKDTTLIEYAAFFGSIQIFQYLFINTNEIQSSVWLYGIHSKNAELINFLELNVSRIKDKYNSKNYDQCLIESIKCHHNDIADYIEFNLIDQPKKTMHQCIEIISNSIKYHNYKYFQIDMIIEYGFFYLGFYHYDKLFGLLLEKKEESIKKKINQYPNIFEVSEHNEIEVIYHLLLKEQRICKDYFSNTELKQILIPTSITSIDISAFKRCSSLTQIAIPSSVTSIGDHTFFECSSLTQITIPSSVTSIGDYAFFECSSLKQITIPSSVTSIGNGAFSRCLSLKQITIPSSVTSITSYALSGCSSLKQITIPSSVTSIGDFAFDQCSSLTQIIIPSSVTSIESHAFERCSSLARIIISSVKSIKKYAFFGCSSLTQVSIPSSVTYIGEYTFAECSSLTQISIPSSVTYIGSHSFQKCTSLAQITIPSVKSIKKYVFNKCSSLKQVLIPFPINRIEEYAFNGCSSLTQIEIPSSIKLVRKNAFKGCSSLKIDPKGN